jgi:hypothetical protein
MRRGWSPRKDQLAWHHVHNEGLRRIAGVPATLRVDNERTAVGRGAGAWGELNPSYRRYARAVRFHIDVCAPRSPEAKGKVERGIGTDRRGPCQSSSEIPHHSSFEIPYLVFGAGSEFDPPVWGYVCPCPGWDRRL